MPLAGVRLLRRRRQLMGVQPLAQHHRGVRLRVDLLPGVALGLAADERAPRGREDVAELVRQHCRTGGRARVVPARAHRDVVPDGEGDGAEGVGGGCGGAPGVHVDVADLAPEAAFHARAHRRLEWCAGLGDGGRDDRRKVGGERAGSRGGVVGRRVRAELVAVARSGDQSRRAAE